MSGAQGKLSEVTFQKPTATRWARGQGPARLLLWLRLASGQHSCGFSRQTRAQASVPSLADKGVDGSNQPPAK